MIKNKKKISSFFSVLLVAHFIFLFTACQNTITKTELKLEIQPENQIVYIDSEKDSLKIETAKYRDVANFNPLYIGKKIDTIVLNYSDKVLEFDSLIYSLSWPNKGDINITVDTSQYIGSIGEIRDIKTDSLGRVTSYYKKIKSLAYPVIIENLSKDCLIIFSDKYVPLTIEILNQKDEWVRIQSWHEYQCPEGIYFHGIPSNEILITSCKLFLGNVKVKMRLAYSGNKDLVSNEFYGQVNQAQYDDANGIVSPYYK